MQKDKKQATIKAAKTRVTHMLAFVLEYGRRTRAHLTTTYKQ